MHVFELWFKAAVPVENPCQRQERVLSSQKSLKGRGIENVQASRLTMKAASSVCHNDHDRAPAHSAWPPPAEKKTKKLHSSPRRPCFRVKMSKRAPRQRCTRKENQFEALWISPSLRLTCSFLISVGAQRNFTLFAPQRPRAAHPLRAHLPAGAQQSAGGGVCGDQAATFGDRPRGSDETIHPSATTSPRPC